MNQPPDVIWLQWYEEDGFEESDDDEIIPHLVENLEPTWESSQVFDSDVRYVKVSSILDLWVMFYEHRKAILICDPSCFCWKAERFLDAIYKVVYTKTWGA